MFLDRVADRYFCLSPDADACLERILGGAPPLPADAAIVARLSSCGLLTDLPGSTALAPCPPAAPITASLLDSDTAPAALRDLLIAGAGLVRASCRLRLRGVNRAIAHLARRSARVPARPVAPEELGGMAAAFARLRHVTTTHDRCLPRSLGVAEALLAARIPCELVIGVKLQPFAAHAWVQSGAVLVNDRIDSVRDFTPILIV